MNNGHFLRRIVSLFIVVVLAAIGTLIFKKPFGSAAGTQNSNSGTAHYQKGEYELAIADFDKAIAQNPTDYFAYYNRGVTYFAQGKYDEAIADLDQSLAIKPQYEDALSERGTAYFEQGQYRKAISDFSSALIIKPNDSELYIIRAMSYQKITQYDLAIADFNAALSLDSKNAKCYFSKAYTCDLAGYKGDAEAAYKEVIANAQPKDQQFVDAAKKRLEELGE